MQYLILKKNKDASTSRQHKEQQKDLGVSQAWEFIEKHWEPRTGKPKMIISVTGGKRQFFMNQRLLKSFKRGLMKAAIAAGENPKIMLLNV